MCKAFEQRGDICYTIGVTLQRGIVQRLVYGSPKPAIVVRFHVPLPSIDIDDESPDRRLFVIIRT
jgi:hypothetical protein